MKTLCIIPCSSKKVWDKNPDAGPTRAGDVYTGTFHKKCREYAERFYRNWVIPSAKYGYLFPDDIVPESYNVTFNRKSSGPITVEQLKEQVRVKGLDRFDRVVVVAGKNYARIIKKSFVDVTEFVYPLLGYSGNGKMMQAMNGAIKNGHPLTGYEERGENMTGSLN